MGAEHGMGLLAFSFQRFARHPSLFSNIFPPKPFITSREPSWITEFQHILLASTRKYTDKNHNCLLIFNQKVSAALVCDFGVPA